jgi:hypothetical protein
VPASGRIHPSSYNRPTKRCTTLSAVDATRWMPATQAGETPCRRRADPNSSSCGRRGIQVTLRNSKTTSPIQRGRMGERITVAADAG